MLALGNVRLWRWICCHTHICRYNRFAENVHGDPGHTKEKRPCLTGGKGCHFREVCSSLESYSRTLLWRARYPLFCVLAISFFCYIKQNTEIRLQFSLQMQNISLCWCSHQEGPVTSSPASDTKDVSTLCSQNGIARGNPSNAGSFMISQMIANTLTSACKRRSIC